MASSRIEPPTGHRCESPRCPYLATYHVRLGPIIYELCEEHAVLWAREGGGFVDPIVAAPPSTADHMSGHNAVPPHEPDPPTAAEVAQMADGPCPCCGAPSHWHAGVEALLDANLFLTTLTELTGDPERKRQQIVSRLHEQALHWMEAAG